MTSTKTKYSLYNLEHKIEELLYKRGFNDKRIRKLSSLTVLITIFLALLALISSPFTLWFFWLFIGTFLSAWQFYALAAGIQKRFLFSPNKTFIFIQLLFAQFRLFICAFIIYGLVSSMNARLDALLVGISFVPVIISIHTLTTRFFQKRKEA